MRPLDFRDRWVIITGASSGLGEAFAREFARRGAKLLLVARRKERLNQLGAELALRYDTVWEAIAMDLSEADAAEQLFRSAVNGREVYALVSSAATHWFGHFVHQPEGTALRMLQLNALTPLGLLRRFLPYFDARGGGGALVVTSTGSVMPTPWQVMYGGSKALLHSAVQSLQYERGGETAEVALCLCCPGAMPTDLLMKSEVRARIERQKLVLRTLMQPEYVARKAIARFTERQLLTVPGKLNQLMVLMSRLLPVSTVGKGASYVYAAR